MLHNILNSYSNISPHNGRVSHLKMFNIPTCNWSHQEPSLAYESWLPWKRLLSSSMPVLQSSCLLSMCFLRTRSLYPISRLQKSSAEWMTACVCICLHILVWFPSLWDQATMTVQIACCHNVVDVHFVYCGFSVYWDSLPSSVVCHFGFLMYIGPSLVSHFVEIQPSLLQCTSHSVTVAWVSTSICPTWKGTDVLQQW